MQVQLKQESALDENTQRRLSLQFQIVSKNVKQSKNMNRLRLTISIVCLSTFYFGYGLAYYTSIPDTTIIQFFGQNTQQSTIKGFLIGIITLGGAVGSFCSPFLMKCFTRRNLILMMNIATIVTAGVIQYSNIYCLFVCRAFEGFFIGNIMAIIPIYINQLSPKQIIQSLGVYTQLFVTFGVAFTFGLGIVLTKTNVDQAIVWRIMFAYSIITAFTVIFSILFGFIPQSPNSLIMKGQRDQAKKVISLFIKNQFVDTVFKQKILQVQVQKNQSNKSKQFGLKYSCRSFFMGFQLPLMQQLTGINAIVTQVGSIVSQHNQEYGYYTPFIINVVQFLFTFLAFLTLKYFGRKTILVSGNITLALLNIILGILFIYIKQYSAIFWIVLAILILYMITYSLTLGPTVWMYVPEIIPAKYVPFATTLNWLASSMCIIILPIVNQNLGNYAIFFIFGGLSLITSLVNIKGLVQTKGLNVEQICEVYK